MLQSIAKQLHRCADMQSVLNCVLDRSIELSDAGFGNIQLMDWKAGYLEIKAQRGFREEFMNFFERVKLEGSSACARALRTRESVVIEDIIVDRQFAPCLEIARRAGIRAVQSTPLVSSSGALVGILSTHFPIQHRPTDIQMRALKEAARLAADAIIRLRARTRTIDLDPANQPNRWFDPVDDRILTSESLLSESREAIVRAETLLARDARIGSNGTLSKLLLEDE